jgi:CheY-like chemotaxis protein
MPRGHSWREHHAPNSSPITIDNRRGAVVDGTCLASSLGVMPMRLPASDFRDRSVKETVTLDLDADKAAAMPVTEVPGDHLFRPGQRVLLLEDQYDFRALLHDHLVCSSFQVTSVPSGVEGLREILKDPFDLIICDMMMPQVGGENFYWAVTRVRPAAAQRFIFITGYQNNPKIQFFFDRVKATVLIKPFPLEELDTAIREVARKLADWRNTAGPSRPGTVDDRGGR